MGHDNQLISLTSNSLLLPCWELLTYCVTWTRLLRIELINQINQVLCLCTFTSHCLLFGHFRACKHILKEETATGLNLWYDTIHQGAQIYTCICVTERPVRNLVKLLIVDTFYLWKEDEGEERGVLFHTYYLVFISICKHCFDTILQCSNFFFNNKCSSFVSKNNILMGDTYC